MNNTIEMTMRQMIDQIWKLPRDLVSDGYDEALSIIGTQVPLIVHEYPTGTQCFTWTVPEKWTCKDARLETIDGDLIFSKEDHPLHVMSYSMPVDKTVTKDELLNHLYTHPKHPEAVPFMYKYYDRDWGLCCSENQKSSLNDKQYRVKIDSVFEQGKLKVGEVIVPGKSEQSIVLCAHLCHPGMVNDDLSGVVVGVEIMRQLAKLKDLKYTYRLLLLPETIGSAAWLSHNEQMIPDIKGGIFLEMLGTRHPLALQKSYDDNSEIDMICRLMLKEKTPDGWSDDFLNIILNDERMFNSPGIRVPMVSISRVLPVGHPDRPYKEYHSSLDNPDHVHWDNLNASKKFIASIINALENNRVYETCYKGELFASGYKSINYRKMRDFIHSVPYYIDGKRTVAEIAKAVNLGLTEVHSFMEILLYEKLITEKIDNSLVKK